MISFESDSSLCVGRTLQARCSQSISQSVETSSGSSSQLPQLNSLKMITFRARLLSLKVFRSVPGVIFKLITLADFHGDHGRAKPKIPSKYVARLRHSIREF